MNERLKNMLKNAYENVPYYRNLFNELGIDISSICNYEKFQQIPLLNKEILRKAPERCPASGGSAERRRRRCGSRS